VAIRVTEEIKAGEGLVVSNEGGVTLRVSWGPQRMNYISETSLLGRENT